MCQNCEKCASKWAFRSLQRIYRIQRIQPIHRIAKDANRSGLDEQRHANAVRSVDEGLLWLAAQQEPSGLWRLRTEATPTDEPDNPTSVDLAITALAVKAFAQRGLESPQLQRGITALLEETARQGGFHGEEGSRASTGVGGLKRVCVCARGQHWHQQV